MTKDPKKVRNALSFDVEEYFHALNFRDAVRRNRGVEMERRVERGTCRILELLASSSVKATFFVLGEVAKSNGSLVREIASAGHEIASHGMSHRTLPELGRDGFKKEAGDSRKLLQDLTGQSVTGFRASTFSITRKTAWGLGVLMEEGYSYDSSVFPVIHDRYGIPDFPTNPVRIATQSCAALVEFPLLTMPLLFCNLPCGGGGYFRIYPAFLTHRAIRRKNAASYPAVIYLHPWEFDVGQPRHRLGGMKTFRHYVNIKKTEPRLKGLLDRFSFDTIGALAEDPEKWPEYRIG